MTLAEIRHSIIDQVSGRFPSDDSRLRFAFIEKLMADKRAVLLAEAMKGRISLEDDWYTVVDCLEVKCGPVSCKGYSSSRTEHYVTMPSVFGGRYGIRFFGTPAGHAFEEFPLFSFLAGNTRILGKSQPVYTVIDDKAIIRNLPYGLKMIRVIAILKEPHKDDESISCLPAREDEEYPMPMQLVHKLELLVIKQLLSTLPIPPDIANDGADKNQVPGRPNPYALG